MLAFDQQEVKRRALNIRKNIITMLAAAGSGHPGGSLSAADILATLYFDDVLRYQADCPQWPKRDRFILSKGHAAPVLYATLAEIGLIPASELNTLRKLGSRLQGHPDCRKLPGVEVSTGSLGQGLSIAAGLALGLTMELAAEQIGQSNGQLDEETERQPDNQTTKLAPDTPFVYTLLGDGELQEGQVWEAAMFAAQKRLGNLIAIVDNNNLQIDGSLEEVNSPYNIAEKFRSFNWHVIEVDGHDVAALKQAFDDLRRNEEGVWWQNYPKLLLAKTVKGKGVGFMENQTSWHGKAPSAEQSAAALAELKESEKAGEY